MREGELVRMEYKCERKNDKMSKRNEEKTNEKVKHCFSARLLF